MTRPTISVVAPLYNEAESVLPLVSELLAVLRPTGETFEIVLVDDGSTDATWLRIQQAAQLEPRLRGLSLVRNFGHQSALLAGLAHSSGRAVISMDGDLQHPPERIPELLAAWRRGCRVVHTRRLDSDDTRWFKRWTSRGFYRVFSALSGFDLPPGSSDFRLLDREVLDTVLAMEDPDPFLRGIVHWLGFPSATVTYRARERHAGVSKFGLRRMLRLSAKGLLSFSALPQRLGIWAGLATGALTCAEIAYLAVEAARGRTPPGWVPALTVTTFLFGVLFLLLGILGAYLVSIHQALRNRPVYLVGRTAGAVRSDGREPAVRRERRSVA